MTELPIPAHDLASMTLSDVYWKGWWDGYYRRNEEEAVEYEPLTFEKPSKYSGPLATRVQHLGLSPATTGILIRGGARYLGELIEHSEAEILDMRNMGPVRLQEVKDCLDELGYSLMESLPRRSKNLPRR